MVSSQLGRVLGLEVTHIFLDTKHQVLSYIITSPLEGAAIQYEEGDIIF